MSEIGNLIKSNNLSWTQIEAYLREKNTSAEIINAIRTIFDEESSTTPVKQHKLNIGGDGTSIYDDEYNSTNTEDADNIFQEANPQIRNNGLKIDAFNVSRAMLKEAVIELANKPAENKGTPNYTFINGDNPGILFDFNKQKKPIKDNTSPEPTGPTNPAHGADEIDGVEEPDETEDIEDPDIAGNEDDPDDVNNNDEKVDNIDITFYPANVQERINDLKKNGDEFTVKSKPDGFIIDVSSGTYLTNSNIKHIQFKYNLNGGLETQEISYNNDKTKTINYNGGRRIIESATSTNKKWVDFADELIKEEFSENANIEYDSTSKEYTITQTNFKNPDIKQIVTTMSEEVSQLKEGETTPTKNDHMVKQVITYTDGHEETITFENGEIKSRATTKTTEEAENEKIKSGEKPTKLRTAAKISFDLPADANADCREFANTLCSEKAQLMQDLGLDNDTYNELAQTAMAIAEKETQMNKLGVTNRLWWKERGSDVISIVRGGKNNCSTGIAQIKLSQWYNDPPKNEEQARLKKHFEKAGITSAEDLKDNKKAAIATIIALSSINRELNAAIYKKGVEKAEQLTVTRAGWELDENGIARNTGHTTPWQNKITKQDQLLLLWNNKSGRRILAEGKFTPQTKDFMYMNVATKANLKYKLVEDAQSRREAEEKERELIIRDEELKPYKNMENNGPMGGIVFMPGMYKTNSQHINSDDEIKALEKVLKNKKINSDISTKLIDALKNKELGFDFGLTENEMNSLTESDIKLLLKHLDGVKKSININTSDGIDSNEAKSLRDNYGAAISAAEDAFLKEYLTNHSPVYDATKTNPKVLRETSTYKGTNNYVSANGERRAFQHQKSKGVNTSTSKGRISREQEVLANAAQKIVDTNPENKSGNCLYGVKLAMQEAGIDITGMAEAGNTPKYVKNCFDQMVNKGVFTRVEYVEVSDTSAREINESDIPTLPAGYFVLYVPDLTSKFSDQAGHLAITNGNGQGYSDSTDNLAWGKYTNNNSDSGKGEHGKFYIYKLSDKWSVDAATGKLKLNG